MDKAYIGIDPDCEKSGVAVWRNKKLWLGNLGFFELYEMLNNAKVEQDIGAVELKVIVEAGWLNKKSNWHSGKTSGAFGEKIAKNVGANHEVGRKIGEMCEYLGIAYEFKQPSSSKLDATDFKKLTKYPGRTNSETRDAAMLVFGY